MQRSNAPSPNKETDKALSALIDDLYHECLEELERYKQKSTEATESDSCLEIVRRAAKKDEAALGILLEKISHPNIAKKCPPDLKHLEDDLGQEVMFRLLRKFQSEDTPFQPTTFAAYQMYLNLTIHHTAIKMRKRNQYHHSLSPNYPQTNMGLGVGNVDIDTKIDRARLFKQCLKQIPDPLEQEVFRRRYGLGESPQEVTDALQTQFADITLKKVYRLTERAIRRLKNSPEIQGLSTS